MNQMMLVQVMKQQVIIENKSNQVHTVMVHDVIYLQDYCIIIIILFDYYLACNVDYGFYEPQFCKLEQRLQIF